jgi:WD40 repeat protein/N-acetyl-anhydromuramyl-L-alanine amidase AmpD
MSRDPARRAYISPKGERVVLTGPRKPRPYGNAGGPFLCAGFSPDAGTLVAVSDSAVHTFDYDGRTRSKKIKTSGCTATVQGAYIFGWDSADASARNVWRFNLRTLAFDAPITLAGGVPIADAVVSPDGKVLSVLRGTLVQVYDGASGQPRGTVSSATNRFALAADGGSVALASASGGVEVWKLAVPPPHPDKVGRRYVLAIGSEYPNEPRASLPGQYADTEMLARVLSERFGYSTTVMKDPRKAEVEVQLDKLADTLSPDDEFVFYFGGHGTRTQASENELVLSIGSEQAVTSGLTSSEVTTWMNRLPARRILVILDSGHSRLARYGQRQANQKDARTRLLLSSADDNQNASITADATPTHSPFLNPIINALTAATRPVSARDLLAAVQKRGKVLTTPDFTQTPHLDPMPAAGHTGGDFVFVPVTPKPAAGFEVRDHRLYRNGTPVRFAETSNQRGRTANPRLITLRSTGSSSVDTSLQTLREGAFFEAHLLIARDGSVIQLTPFDGAVQVASDVSASGQINAPRMSIHIALANAGKLIRLRNDAYRDSSGKNHPEDANDKIVMGEDEGWQAYTPEQLRVAKEIVRTLVRAYPDIQRLAEESNQALWPGPAFPWAEFQALLPTPTQEPQETTLTPTDVVFKGHTKAINSVAFSPDSRRIVSASDDGTLRIWDAKNGAQIGPPLEGHGKPVLGVAFSPNGERIVSAGEDNTLRLWNARTGKPLGDPLQGHSDYVTRVAFSPDGSRIVSGSRDGTLIVWDAGAGQPTIAWRATHESWVTSVAISPDGRLIASGALDNNVKLWDSMTGRLVAVLGGHGSTVQSVTFSPDGKRIASGGRDKTVRIWDVNSQRPIGAPLTGHAGDVWQVAFSPDARWIASSSWDDTVWIWDAATAKPIGKPLEVGGMAWGIAFSPDGSSLIASSNNDLRLYHIERTRRPNPQSPAEQRIREAK